jgi:hypothetical protein
MVELSPSVSSTDLSSRKDNRIEDYVVFSDELIELDLPRIAPPLFLLIRVSGSNGHVSDTSIKPRIYNLVFVAR